MHAATTVGSQRRHVTYLRDVFGLECTLAFLFVVVSAMFGVKTSGTTWVVKCLAPEMVSGLTSWSLHSTVYVTMKEDGDKVLRAILRSRCGHG